MLSINVTWLYSERVGANGPRFRTNVAGLRGSSTFHDPLAPKLDMYPNPDLLCVNRKAIGRFGELGETAYPLLLMRAAHVVSDELYNNPLDYSVSRRVNPEGKARRVYSQRREAQAKVAATLIMHTSLEYGMVGKLDGHGKFHHMSLQEIASHAGVGLERAKRVMTTFKRKGALKVGKQFEKLKDNRIGGRNSIRHLTEGFWAMFGFGEWMKAEVKKRRTAREKQTQGAEDTQDTSLLSNPYKPQREQLMDKMEGEAGRERLVDEIQKLSSSAFLNA